MKIRNKLRWASWPKQKHSHVNRTSTLCYEICPLCRSPQRMLLQRSRPVGILGFFEALCNESKLSREILHLALNAVLMTVGQFGHVRLHTLHLFTKSFNQSINQSTNHKALSSRATSRLNRSEDEVWIRLSEEPCLEMLTE